MNVWSKLFLHSIFFSLNKENSIELQDTRNSLILPGEINGFHPNRKEEFILGRICATKAHRLLTGEDLPVLLRNSDRSPQWPNGIVGSISHNQDWVGAAVAKESELLGIGIDFEVMGRTKLELSKQIRSSGDLLKAGSLTEEELLTLIFSAKESLYKALYPKARVFFGFEAASVREISFVDQSFEIELHQDISPLFGPRSRHIFRGKFAIERGTCLTVIEVSS